MPNIVDITVRSTDDTQPVMDAIEARYKLGGQKAADAFTRDANGRLHDNLGRFAAEADLIGAGLADGIGTGLTRELPDKVEKPLKDSGKKSGQGFAAGMSPLLLSAFTGAATLGPVALIAGAGVAAAGIAAILARSNANIASEYQALGHDVSATLSGAVAPFAADIEKSINILDQGLGTVGPELKNVFAAAAPYSEDIANSLVTIVERMLPGFTAGLQEAAPIMQVLATFTGDIGQGVGDFVQKLGTGSSGAATGLQALGVSLEHILGDVGQIAGTLSSGMGPALKDVLEIVTPLADAGAKFVSAFPPGAIHAAADATLALFLAFKAASLAGLLTEGASFLSFLRGTAIAEGAATTATEAMSAAMDAIPLVAVGAAIAGLAVAAEKLGGAGDHTSINIDQFTNSLIDAANGSQQAQDGVVKLATSYALMNGTMGMSLQGLKDIDSALANLQATDPAAAAKEFDAITASLEKQGKSADEIAKDFPQYTKAVQDAQIQQKIAQSTTTALANSFSNLSIAMVDASASAQKSAQQNAATTLSALGLTDGESTLAQQLGNTLEAFSLATGASSAYKSSLDALYNKYASYSQAQATFTEQLNAAAKSLIAGKDAVDLNTEAGSKNFTTLNQLSQANEQVAESFIKQGGSVDDANKKLQAGALEIDNLARKAGFSADQVAQLNTELYGTANIKDIRVNIGADTSSAFNSVNNTLRYIDNQVAYIQVQAVGGTAGGKQLLASGGAVGGSRAQSGGPRGNVVTVGEHGIEDVRLPVGSTVFSHEDTMAGRAYAGAGGSGPAHLLVEWVGSGNEALDALWTALRGHIRFRAGGGPDSVQRALGQN